MKTNPCIFHPWKRDDDVPDCHIFEMVWKGQCTNQQYCVELCFSCEKIGGVCATSTTFCGQFPPFEKLTFTTWKHNRNMSEGTWQLWHFAKGNDLSWLPSGLFYRLWESMVLIACRDVWMIWIWTPFLIDDSEADNKGHWQRAITSQLVMFDIVFRCVRLRCGDWLFVIATRKHQTARFSGNKEIRFP